MRFKVFRQRKGGNDAVATYLQYETKLQRDVSFVFVLSCCRAVVMLSSGLHTLAVMSVSTVVQ